MSSFFFIWACFAFLLGTILGSFLNALLFRYHTGVGMGGRSRCMRCAHTLSPLDLIPILSYLLLGGRCRYCKSRISLQYPSVELAAGFLALSIFWLYPMQPLLFILGLLTWMALLFIVVYDTQHFILPLEALALLGALGLLSIFFLPAGGSVTSPAAWGGAFLAGPLVGAPLLFLSAVSGGRWMGWGDGLLMVALGWALGLWAGLTALVLGFWSGAATGLLLIAWSAVPVARRAEASRGFTMRSEIPFAPFLVFGAAVVYFFHFNLFSIFLI